jgi:polysaccharide export outer membrane protein
MAGVVVVSSLLPAVTRVNAQTAPPPPAGSGVPQNAPARPAQPKPSSPADKKTSTSAPPTTAAVALPPGFVLGPDDVLSVAYWRDKDMSADTVVVRPDGKITLPLLNEIQASGLTPDQLRDAIATAATKYVEDPNVTVIVKQVNSRKVYITGEVGKPGAYPLTGPTTVIQLIAMAGGVQEYAKKKDIVVMRIENGHQYLFPFNYEAVSKRRNMKQNIELKPGDTVIVP